MYNSEIVNQLVDYVDTLKGMADKKRVADAVKNKFSLVKDGKVYYCDSFAIRFGWNGRNDSKRISNTVLGLSKIKSYDDRPLLFCIVTHNNNHLLLINTTFLKKVSHSSQDLRIDNIRGSINCSDIMMEYNSIKNEPHNFERLYAYHVGFSFEDNLERIVECTNGIVGRIPKLVVTDEIRRRIIESVLRSQEFVESSEYRDLKADLDSRVSQVKSEIAIAAFIENNKIRGSIIEYLITGDDSDYKTRIIDALNNDTPLPEFTLENGLGDYSKEYPSYHTATDIKTKVLFLAGNPKAYNIDKLLEFLSTPKSIYMIYLLGVDEEGQIVSRLCSFLHHKIIKATCFQHHWAGRNTRGTTQFTGQGLKEIFDSCDSTTIDLEEAYRFIELLISK